MKVPGKRVVVVCGPPAAGKTTVGRRLARERQGTLLDIDVVTERLVRRGLVLAGHSADDRDSAFFKDTFRNDIYETLFDVACDQPAGDVVIVGPFTKELRDADWRERLRVRLQCDSVEIWFVQVVHVCASRGWSDAADQCSQETQRRRMAARANPRDAAKLQAWEQYASYFDGRPPACPHIIVNNEYPGVVLDACPFPLRQTPDMMRAVRIAKTGGPEVLQLLDVPLPVPKSNEVRIRAKACGVNMIDTYYRTGVYPPAPQVATFPLGIGQEVCGVVDAVGADVKDINVGDRVGTPFATGAYAEAVCVAGDRVVHVPPAVSDVVAASVLLKGMTARYLCRKTYSVGQGTTALVFAAAGGTGQILTQWITALGGTVFAVVSTEAKAAIVRGLGAKHVIFSSEDVPAKVKEYNGGKGVDVVYDSVGKDTFEASLNSVRPLGMFVSYGNASGPVPPFAPLLLSKHGSLFFTRPSLFHYCATREQLQETAADLFDVIQKGHVKVEHPSQYPLAECGRAHADLEGRRTTGSLVLLP